MGAAAAVRPEDPVISIVMPAHNEASMLEASVRDVVSGMRGWGETFEVNIVENGSTDGTPAIAARLAEQLPEVSTSSMRAADYGEALRMGLLEASGEIGVIFDVDYYDLDFLKAALQLLDPSDSPTGPAIVVGSKRAPGARDERSGLRRSATSIFSGILRLGFGLTLSDTHGIKALNLLALRDAVRACQSGADLFDSELIIRAEYSGLITAEVPVTVSELRPSRTSIAKRVPRTLLGLAKLRLRLGAKPRG
jgi:glycosyltransferase involved in cell wall biosynthesis